MQFVIYCALTLSNITTECELHINEAPLVRVLPRSQEASHQQAHHERNSNITCSHVVI